MTLDGGAVGLVVDEGAGPTAVGCMSMDTAATGAELSLSLASIRPGEDGVTVAIAVPAGRKIRDLSWLDPTHLTITPTDDEITQLDVYSFVVSSLAEPPSDATPSEAQLADLIRQAFEGTSTAAGLAPDILSP